MTVQKINKFRFYSGIFVLITGQVLPLFIPFIQGLNLPSNWKNLISGLLLMGFPQLFTLLSIIILGKEGFQQIKTKVSSKLKRYAFPERVSRIRYQIGLVLFVLPFIWVWLEPYAFQVIPNYQENRMTFSFLLGDLLLIISLFVLGSEFWGKLRALFIYNAKVSGDSHVVKKNRSL